MQSTPRQSAHRLPGISPREEAREVAAKQAQAAKQIAEAPRAVTPPPPGVVVCNVLRDFMGAERIGFAATSMVRRGSRIALSESLAHELAERGLVSVIVETTAASGPSEAKG